MKVEIWTDGAAYKQQGPTTDNPRRGHAGAGFVVVGDGFRCCGKTPLGLATNNEAEYQAIIRALVVARDVGATAALLRTDSDVVHGQVKGQKRCKKPHLKSLREKVMDEALLFSDGVEFECVDREANGEADSLAKAAKKMSLAGVSHEEVVTSWGTGQLETC